MTAALTHSKIDTFQFSAGHRNYPSSVMSSGAN